METPNTYGDEPILWAAVILFHISIHLHTRSEIEVRSPDQGRTIHTIHLGYYYPYQQFISLTTSPDQSNPYIPSNAEKYPQLIIKLDPSPSTQFAHPTLAISFVQGGTLPQF